MPSVCVASCEPSTIRFFPNLAKSASIFCNASLRNNPIEGTTVRPTSREPRAVCSSRYRCWDRSPPMHTPLLHVSKCTHRPRVPNRQAASDESRPPENNTKVVLGSYCIRGVTSIKGWGEPRAIAKILIYLRNTITDSVLIVPETLFFTAILFDNIGRDILATCRQRCANKRSLIISSSGKD